ncbi:MAG: hypothetical protein QW146_09015 [Candidatus Bathyarchaeia archaeon]
MRLQSYSIVVAPEVVLQNGSDNVSYVYASNTSAKISINASPTSTTYNYTLNIVNINVSQNWNVKLEVFEANLNNTLSVGIVIHDGITPKTQIIVDSGILTQTQGDYYELAGSLTLYIGVQNLQQEENALSLLHAYLIIQIPNTSIYTLYIITFEFS